MALDITLVIPIAGAVGLAFAGYLTWYVFRKDLGSPEMQEIGSAIRSGANAYMRRQYTTIIIISAILAVVIAALITPRLYVGLSFFVGAMASALSGYIGMYVSVRSNIRTAAAARRSLDEALRTSFRGGAVSGMGVVSLSLLGVAGVYYIYSTFVFSNPDPSIVASNALDAAIGFAFGASFSALFAQLGGGIYTKAADVGADLVGKVEAGIPEDDPRNPAVIADLVGDNVGDCAGRGADLFESTAAENIGAMVLGLTLFKLFTGAPFNWEYSQAIVWVFFPLVARSFGIFASLAGVLMVRLKNESKDPMSGINIGYYLTCTLAAIFFYIATYYMFGADLYLYFFGAGIIGIVLSIAIVYITQYYTSGSWRPVREIAQASTTGPATNIITGLSIAMETTALPVIAIIVALLGAFYMGHSAAAHIDGTVVNGALVSLSDTDYLIFGFYGTAVATMGMLATCAFILATDTFGPITDNAGGIIEMSKQPEDIRRRTDRLDACGNTTKALTKGYAMASAALAAFLLFGAYFERVAAKSGILLSEAFRVDLAHPEVFVGGLLGAMLVFLFASLAIRAVGKAAYAMINEVRRQFKADPGIMANTSKPDYAKCVDIATKGALKAMVFPALLPVVVPVAFGIIMAHLNGYDSPMAVGGLLMIGTITGIMVANMFNNGGGAWDNGKKYIEAGEFGGKRSPAHAAAVVGDTVGDPLKDTAGPSIHVLVKLLSTVTLVFVGLFVL